MTIPLNWFPRDRRRQVTHLGLAALTVAICLATYWLMPGIRLRRVVAIGTGYLALVLLAATLIIGPVELWRQRRRRNPVNIHLRRDLGIWCGLTGIVHVILSFMSHMKGEVLRFFFERVEAGYRPLTNLFGASNYIGAAATGVLLLLLIISNDISLRRLKGKLWKNLQRLNYGLFVLVVVHTLAYQVIVDRTTALRVTAVGLTLLVVLLQTAGFIYFRQIK